MASSRWRSSQIQFSASSSTPRVPAGSVSFTHSMRTYCQENGCSATHEDGRQRQPHSWSRCGAVHRLVKAAVCMCEHHRRPSAPTQRKQLTSSQCRLPARTCRLTAASGVSRADQRRSLHRTSGQRHSEQRRRGAVDGSRNHGGRKEGAGRVLLGVDASTGGSAGEWPLSFGVRAARSQHTSA